MPGKRRRRRPAEAEVRNVLQLMATRTQLGSLEEGDTYVCSVCNLPVKPCGSDPAHLCSSKVREGTQLQLLRSEAHAVEQKEYGTCAVCGKPFTKRERLSNPLREVCRSCQPSTTTRRRSQRRQE